MPNYKYRVIFEDGRIGRGKIIAANRASAIDKLKTDNNQPIMLKKMNDYAKYNTKVDYRKIKKNPAAARSKKKKKKIDITKMTLKELKEMDVHPFTTIKPKDIIAFVNDIYILKQSKFTNVQALQAVYDGTENPVFKDVIEDLLIGVESGERLYNMMEVYPKVFPPMFVNFVKVGEESGNLDTALLYARDYVEENRVLKKKIVGAIVPRVLQFALIIIAMFIALIIGVPIVQEVYDMFDSDQQIPKATQIGLSVAQWSVEHWYRFVIIMAVVYAIFYIYTHTGRGRYNWDKFLMTCPVLGDLVTNIIISKFFTAMLLNLKNGMRIQESLDVSKSVSSNYYFLSALETGKANILSGGSWIEPFSENKIFKPMVREMLTIGMKTDLTEMMEKVNEYIRSEINEALERFVKVLPEVTYAIVGVALIAFVITVMIPLINVYMGSFISIS